MFTYSGDPSMSYKDEVRFIIGDVDEKNPILEDEEINYLLKKYNNEINLVLIKALCSTIAKLTNSSDMVDIKIGNIEEKNTKKIEYLQNLLDQLKSEYSPIPQVYLGGLYVSDVENFEENESYTQPLFKKGSRFLRE